MSRMWCSIRGVSGLIFSRDRSRGMIRCASPLRMGLAPRLPDRLIEGERERRLTFFLPTHPVDHPAL